MQRHFVSYPKSGRSWIRYILVQLGVEKEISFHHDGFEFSDYPKGPHNFNLDDRLLQYSQVEKLVYLERDFRDVMVSFYFQITGRMRDVHQYQGSMSEFLRDGYFGAHNLKFFRQMWSEIIERRNFLKVTYEDCHQDIENTMRAILGYYGFVVDESRLVESIGNADFGKMKELERSGTFPEPWLRQRNNAPKVRQGLIGGYRDVLSEDDIAYLNGVFGDWFGVLVPLAT